VNYRLFPLALLFSLPLPAAVIELRPYPHFLRADPFGDVVEADRAATNRMGDLMPRDRTVVLAGARGGYVSFQLLAKAPQGRDYTLDVRLEQASRGLEIDAFREWYHFLDPGRRYYPDALIPVRFPYHSRLPQPDNHIQRQNCQAFWVNVWIPPGTAPGSYRGRALLQTGSESVALPLALLVLSATVPEQDAVTIDHNSYGSSWLEGMYPTTAGQTADFYSSDALFRLIHAYHRIFYEHRGVFHQLGYGHAGKVGPEFAPKVEGQGRTRHITSWELYDRHYGSLFDGTAFAGSRRGARPIPFAYLPINPEWPASFLNWGEPGYETEFVSVVSEMERHFRQKGWTKTDLEVFFNHKKRYMGFPWDGDEVRFARDNRYFSEYARLLRKALPRETPVRFVFRADVSWNMEQQFKELREMVRMWVCNGAILSWNKDSPRVLRKRGDIVWYYSGPPSVTEPSSAITKFPFQAWIWGVNGFVHWLAVDPGADPWFHFEGGETALVYPGEKFGVTGPIPSIRLKIQRNCLEDIALLESMKSRHALSTEKAETTRRYNQSAPQDWWNPRPAMADLPSDEWTGAGIDAATARTRRLLSNLRPDAWASVHEYTMQLASEVP
jgi:Domain of unknown function (DUF4091)